MLTWPSILTPRGIMFEPDARSRSGGVSLSGVEQVVTSSGGIWRARYTGVPVVRRNQRLAWRAINAQLGGRAGVLLVPVFCGDPPTLEGVSGYSGVTHSDGTFFGDEAGYSQSALSATINPAALRATSVTINIIEGEVEAGQHFSVSGRLYRVASVESQSGGVASITIWPPLREAVAVEVDAEFARPVCRMRLASDDAMNIEFDMGRFGTGAVDFIEAL